MPPRARRSSPVDSRLTCSHSNTLPAVETSISKIIRASAGLSSINNTLTGRSATTDATGLARAVDWGSAIMGPFLFHRQFDNGEPEILDGLDHLDELIQ